MVCVGDFAWVQELRDEEAAQFKSKWLRRLDLVVPSGQRIRNLRAVLGWTQRTAALQLGISVRTVIRYEQGHHRVSWPRVPLLRRLRELESDHAQELIAYLTRGGPERA
jgi:DNA-binding XRE family transcriptional regulator